ncbi:MAG TPA: hypothetical protein VGI10_10840 [Polyangiaceae bacterium]
MPSGLKRRVRERLLVGRSRSWLPAFARPAFAVFALLVAVGAAAAVGHALLARGEHAAAASGQLALARPKQPLGASPVSPIAAPDSEPAAPAAAAANDVAVEPAPPAVGAAPDARRASAERDAHVTADTNALSEATLVYGAAKALRSSGDPALAAKLLDDYARRYPHGALAEEALALSIDVSLARGDGRAKQLATRYLARYPSGHFQVKAERVLAQ